MTRPLPSVPIAATSMPSSEVPLISPTALYSRPAAVVPAPAFVLDDAAMSPKDPAAKSEFLKAATERGYIHQCTDWEALDSRLAAGTVTGYIGYDCTADSL